MKKLIFSLLVLLLALQWRWWFGDGGVREVHRYQAEVRLLSARLEEQKDLNRALAAEVEDLRSGLDEIEARARAELGMIRDDETFYQFVGESAVSHSGRASGQATGSHKNDPPATANPPKP